MKKYLAFDIETAKVVPEGQDLMACRPLGICCAATLPSDGCSPILWYGQTEGSRTAGQMSQQAVVNLVRYLVGMNDTGYTILSWNGLGFDFDILAEESGLLEECRVLALGHVDMMYQVFCERGHRLGLQAAARGMGLEGKSAGITGAEAPRLWAAGDHQRVLDYNAQDVRTTLELARKCEEQGFLQWITASGVPSRSPISLTPAGWLTVHQAWLLPEPDTSWMDHPEPRSKFTGWLQYPKK